MSFSKTIILIYKMINRGIKNLLILCLLVLGFFSLLFRKRRKKKIFFGPVPMIQYAYWKKSLIDSGYEVETIVYDHYKIHPKETFDKYTVDMVPKIFRFNKTLKLKLFAPFYGFYYVANNGLIFNTSFFGGFFGETIFWKVELLMYKFFGIKILVSGYGGDFYAYSKVLDKSLTHALLSSYPNISKEENIINKKINFLVKKSDIILNGVQVDGLGRWDVLPVNMITIPDNMILEKKKHKNITDEIVIVHAPNHRGFKGSEFIIDSVEKLINEGFKINFILLEGYENKEVIKVLKEKADILVEQVIFSGYALNAIEGMSLGIPVLSNLSNNLYLEPFRRYSYLSECPILSTTPENLKNNIKLLIQNTQLRNELGKLGIQYVKKYHSESTAKFMFGKIYNQLINKVDEDLINMFHPLKSDFVKNNYINTPLSQNRYNE
tara:strand:+ start:87 stop:1394 length:1308 start_codon:yes stop_codon:yes gene_type:complete